MKKAKVFAICGALSLTLAAAGMAGCSGETSVDGTATALVINGEEVNAGTANFILRYQQAPDGLYDGELRLYHLGKQPVGHGFRYQQLRLSV